MTATQQPGPDSTPGAREAIERAIKFIADEYRDSSYEPQGEWLPPKARKVHADLIAALQAEAVSEAVGWQYRWKVGDKWTRWHDTEQVGYWKNQPEVQVRALYASPPPNPEGAADPTQCQEYGNCPICGPVVERDAGAADPRVQEALEKRLSTSVEGQTLTIEFMSNDHARKAQAAIATPAPSRDGGDWPELYDTLRFAKGDYQRKRQIPVKAAEARRDFEKNPHDYSRLAQETIRALIADIDDRRDYTQVLIDAYAKLMSAPSRDGLVDAALESSAAREIATKIASRPALAKLIDSGALKWCELCELREDIERALRSRAISSRSA